MPRLTVHELEQVLDDTTETTIDRRQTGQWRNRQPPDRFDVDDADKAAVSAARPKRQRPADGSETFRCRHCHAMIEPTVSGGRHRNHCPLCLYSRHVDDRRPGDRASPCRSLMAPIGTFFRPKGEQVVVHRCLGCGIERFNRVAADDNDVMLMRLPLVPPRVARGEVSTVVAQPTAADDREAG